MNFGLGVDVNGQTLTGTAKWADILKMCETDKRNVMYRVLNNMTDRHVKRLHRMPLKSA
jgi:hypothetical protein